MEALQNAVVNHGAETHSLYRRVCPDCHTFRAVKDYTTRRIRTVFGTVRVRNPRWMVCSDCYPGMVGAFAPLKEICPDRATSEMMTGPVMDDVADLRQLEQENARLRKALAEKLWAENAELRKRSGLA